MVQDNHIRLDEFDIKRNTDASGNEQVVIEHRISGNTYIFDKNGEITSSSVGASTINGFRYVLPGESIQTAIDDVASTQGTVVLHPDTTFDEGAEIAVKQGVTLDCQHATIEINADHNGMYLDNNAIVMNADIHVVTTSFTSDAVVLNTGRCVEGAYGSSPAHFQGKIRNEDSSGNPQPNGNGVALRAEGGTGGLSFCNLLIERSFGFNNGIHANAVDSFINGNYIQVGVIAGATHLIRHTGTNAFETNIYGVLQNGWPTDYGIRNDSGARSCWFIGEAWDIAKANVTPLDGKQMVVWTRHHIAKNIMTALNTQQASNGSCVFGYGNITHLYGNVGSGDYWEYTFGGKMTCTMNGVNVSSIDSAGNMILKGTLTESGTP